MASSVEFRASYWNRVAYRPQSCGFIPQFASFLMTGLWWTSGGRSTRRRPVAGFAGRAGSRRAAAGFTLLRFWRSAARGYDSSVRSHQGNGMDLFSVAWHESCI